MLPRSDSLSREGEAEAREAGCGAERGPCSPGSARGQGRGRRLVAASLRRLSWCAVAGLWLAGCRTTDDPWRDGGQPDPLAPLRAWETERRESTNFEEASPSSDALGPDPYDVVALGQSGRAVGVLRGAARLVLLDAGGGSLHEVQTSAYPVAVAAGPGEELFVVTELGSMLERFIVRRDRLEAAGAIVLPDLRALRDVSVAEDGSLLVVDEFEPRLVSLDVERAADSMWLRGRRDHPAAPGTLTASFEAGLIRSSSILDHSVTLRDRASPAALGEAPVTHIRHDGPIWASVAVRRDDRVLLAAAGVENRPLDRTAGSFGYVDSFVWLYEVVGGPGNPARPLFEVNVSAVGVVTPKAIHASITPGGLVEIVVVGAGGDRAARIAWRPDLPTPSVSTFEFPPGTSAVARVGPDEWVAANPLLDAWVTASGARVRVVPVPPAAGSRPPTDEERLGEVLFFTRAMAPWTKSDGALSRFTCETCHFEGYVDGRTHHTGRGAVRATTKPLLGLLSNRPYFSRALDRDLAGMVHAEFKVAGANSGRDPWFSLGASDLPWLTHVTKTGTLGPIELRRALMAFLARFTHRPNPGAWGRSSWTVEETRGAEVFRDRCVRCHSARLVADDAHTEVAFERWEALTLSAAGAVVWGRNGYEKTGVEPYVHAEGARVPSLRRLYKKRPYFTNGSSHDLRALLGDARVGDARFLHLDDRRDPSLRPLDAAEVRVLLAFLRLL